MAFGLTWNSWAETDLDFKTFYGKAHTVSAWLCFQYPRAYRGPAVAADGDLTYVAGLSDWRERKSAPSGLTPSLYVAFGGGPVEIINTDPAIEAGKWYHLVLTGDGTKQIKVYFDGKKRATIKPGKTAPTGRLRFGKSRIEKSLGPDQFYGLVSEVIVLGAETAEDDVGPLGDGTIPSGAPVLGEWGMNGGVGPSKVDLNGNTERVDVVHGPGKIKGIPWVDPPTDRLEIPYPSQVPLIVTQGFGGEVSHNDFAHFALDLELTSDKKTADHKATMNAKFVAAIGGKVADTDTSHPTSSPANYVTVEHKSLEFVDYLHLFEDKKAKLPPKIGTKVSTGDDIGLTGNSDTADPHLHIAETNYGEGDNIRKKQSDKFLTIPFRFSRYELWDGGKWKDVTDSVPEKGQVIQKP